MRSVVGLAVAACLVVISAIGASAAPFDCRARGSRSDDAPPVAAGDQHPWQCAAGTGQVSSATQWQRHSLEYCRLSTSVYGAALGAARTMKARRHLKWHGWIVIMDADETLLDNSLNEVQRDKCNDTGFNSDVWESWVHARATPQSERGMADDVPGAAAFTQAVRHMGGLVAVVTNRDVADDAITRGNLSRLGIAFDYEIGQDASKPDEKKSKLTRWQAAVAALSGQFHTKAVPVMWVGDQVTDLAITDAKGNMTGAMSQTDEGGQGTSVGVNRFLVPNPMYGNWKH